MTLEQRIDQLESLLRGRQLSAAQRDKAEAELQRLLAEKAAFDRAFEAQFGGIVRPAAAAATRRRPQVLNIHVVGRRETADRKYIGRGSIWENPFRIGEHGNRDRVCDQYEAWFRTQTQLVVRLYELRGKDLLCFCAPKRCHGYFLIKAANA